MPGLHAYQVYTYINTDGLFSIRSIKYHTTELSSGHCDTSINSVQVDISIISSVSIKHSTVIRQCRNSSPIRKEPVSLSIWRRVTAWPPVSDALESRVGCSIGLPNLGDGNDTVVSIDHIIQ